MRDGAWETIGYTVACILLAVGLACVTYGAFFAEEPGARAGVNPAQLRCEEDEVIIGIGGFDGEVWEAYACEARDNL